MSTKDKDWGSAVRTWYRNLSWFKILITGVLAVAAAVGTLVGAFTGVLTLGKEVTEWRRSPTFQEVPRFGGVAIWQGPTKRDMVPEDADATSQIYNRQVRVSMSREPFELRFPYLPQDTNLRICAWTDDSIFAKEDSTPISNGSPMSSIPCLKSQAAGDMIPSPVGDEYTPVTLLLSQTQRNSYQGPKKLGGTGGEKRIFVGSVLPIDSEAPPSLSASDRTDVSELDQEIFLLVFIDENGDERLDTEEYEYIVLDFGADLRQTSTNRPRAADKRSGSNDSEAKAPERRSPDPEDSDPDPVDPDPGPEAKDPRCKGAEPQVQMKC